MGRPHSRRYPAREIVTPILKDMRKDGLLPRFLPGHFVINLDYTRMAQKPAIKNVRREFLAVCDRLANLAIPTYEIASSTMTA